MCLTILSTFTEFNGNSFGDIVGFGMICLSFNTSYFVMDRFTDKVYILNDNWSLVSFAAFYFNKHFNLCLKKYQ